MKINKEFVNLLIEEKEFTTVYDLIGEDGLKMIISGKKTLNSLKDLDEIFYTIDFLEKENIIIIRKSINIRAPHVGDCLRGGY